MSYKIAMQQHQHILPLITSEAYNIDEFIISSSNRNIYNIIQSWPKSWGVEPYKFCILLYGPKSSGKTYIAKIWQHITNARIIQKDLSVSENLCPDNNAVILEDIETNISDSDILHYINFFNEQRRYLLLTTSRRLHNFQLTDLASRINSIFTVKIDIPDDNLMKMLIFKYFANYSIKLSDNVLSFLLAILPREFNKILMMLEHINNFALINHRNITVPLIKDLIQSNNKLCLTT